IAAVRGERFPKKRTADNAWRDARATATLGAGERATVTIACGFEPKRVVVDPDVHVLMLERKKAELVLRAAGGAPGSLAAAGPAGAAGATETARKAVR